MYGDRKRTWLDDKLEKEFHKYAQRHVGESLPTREIEYTTRIEYNASGDPIYVGDSAPGLKSNEIGWRIKKLTYNAGSDVVQIGWADGSDAFIRIWDRRAKYNYS